MVHVVKRYSDVYSNQKAGTFVHISVYLIMLKQTDGWSVGGGGGGGVSLKSPLANPLCLTLTFCTHVHIFSRVKYQLTHSLPLV